MDPVTRTDSTPFIKFRLWAHKAHDDDPLASTTLEMIFTAGIIVAAALRASAQKLDG